MSSRVRARAKVTPVESAVQPLRTVSTEPIPIRNGTAVTSSTAYQARTETRDRSVAARAVTEARVAVRQSTGMVSTCTSESPAANTISA